MKEVLLITYYWPPSGGAGVQRWLRFSKYFEENGIQLHVYHPSNPSFGIIDQELRKQVSPKIIEIENSIFEPHRYLGKGAQAKGSGLTSEKKRSLFKKFTIWVRGNLFIPDARVFWINPSVRYLKDYLKKHPEITTVISTGPPHSLHVIALKLKKKIDFKWIADFRDPWTEIDFYQELNIGKWADARQKKLEKACLQAADEVVTVSPTWAEGLSRIGQRPVHVISNGYDFPAFDKNKVELDENFSIAHFGSMPSSRNAKVLWKVLGQLVRENPLIKQQLKINLYGSVDFTIFESINENGLEGNLRHIAMIPHSESILAQRRTQLLLLVANNSANTKGILTGKFFEYLGAQRPILTLGKEGGDLKSAVDETDCGAFFDYEQETELKDYILLSFEKYQTGNFHIELKNTEQFNSRFLAKKMCDLC